jgi:hypothetical protein
MAICADDPNVANAIAIHLLQWMNKLSYSQDSTDFLANLVLDRVHFAAKMMANSLQWQAANWLLWTSTKPS